MHQVTKTNGMARLSQPTALTPSLSPIVPLLGTVLDEDEMVFLSGCTNRISWQYISCSYLALTPIPISHVLSCAFAFEPCLSTKWPAAIMTQSCSHHGLFLPTRARLYMPHARLPAVYRIYAFIRTTQATPYLTTMPTSKHKQR